MITHQKLGQSDLLYGSKLPAENSVCEQAFSSQLSLSALEMLVAYCSAYQNNDITEFEKILKTNRETIMEDPFIREHIEGELTTAFSVP